ncbi:MAG: 2,3-bisphosphoglycerate-independent phosphoglycerate mutase [Candidatus Micrarchaeia archaeon]
MAQALLIVCDGLGDLPSKNGKTPLQAAKKPNIDRLAKKGATGLLYTISPGIIPGSDTSHLALFGYEPEKFYPGRGPLEALGIGIELRDGDIAFRSNFATVDKDMNIIDRRAGRIEEGADELAKLIDGKEIDTVKIILKHSTQHRCALILRGDGLSANITDVDPHGAGKVLKSEPIDSTPEARKTSKVLNDFTKLSYDILSKAEINTRREREGKLPANIILSRGAGAYRRIQPFKERHGFSAACIAGGALYKGVAKYVGMDVIEVKGAIGTFNTDLSAKAKAVLEAFKTHEFVFLHIKGTDNAGHDGDFDGKVAMIEKIDAMIGDLTPKLPEGTYIILTGDHSTPISLKRHSSDPTPILIYGKNVRVDDVEKFDEISCARGSLGHLRGIELMPIIKDKMGHAHVYGS